MTEERLVAKEKPRRRAPRRPRTPEAPPRALEPEVVVDAAEPAPEVLESSAEADLSAAIPELVVPRPADREEAGALVPFDPLQRYLHGDPALSAALARGGARARGPLQGARATSTPRIGWSPATCAWW